MKEEHVYSIQKRTKSLARHTQSKDKLSQKDGTQMRRTIQDRGSPRTCYLSAQITYYLEDP